MIVLSRNFAATGGISGGPPGRRAPVGAENCATASDQGYCRQRTDLALIVGSYQSMISHCGLPTTPNDSVS